MRRLQELVSRLRAHRRGSQMDADLHQEIDSHLDEATAEYVQRGLAPDAARREALRHFGGVLRVRDLHHDARTFRWLDDFIRDARLSLRGLRRTPGFSIVAIVTLSLGIGATTAIYSVVDAILLQPLPFAHADRLVRIHENVPSVIGPSRVFQEDFAYSDFLEWRTRLTTLSDVVAFGSRQVLVKTDQGTARLWGGATSSDTFALLNPRMLLGRGLESDDDTNQNVIVLGFDAWRRLFHGDSNAIGKTLEIQGATPQLLTIVGVLPEAFEFPSGPLDFCTPISTTRPPPRVSVLGLLKPGASLEAAAEEVSVVGSSIRPPLRQGVSPLTVPRFEVQPLKDQIVKELRPALRLILAAAGILLLIVCTNVANLLLARGAARQREMAVQFALGANRGRIIRQLLAESIVLALGGGVCGAFIGAAGVALVKQLAVIQAPGIFRTLFGTTILPRAGEITVNLQVFATAFGVAALAAIACGLLPALRLSRRPRQVHALGVRGGGSHGDRHLRGALVVGQLTLATLLLVGAGLMVKSFMRLASVDKGYDASNVLAVQLLFPGGQYPLARRMTTIAALLSRLRALPNVESAGFSRAGVLIGEEIVVGTFVPNGQTLEEVNRTPEKPRLRSISEGFLPAMGIRFLSGRDLSAADDADARPVIVINRAAATQLFGDRNPVGQFVEWHLDAERQPVEVVGVVEPLRNESLEHEPFPEIFMDYRQIVAVLRRAGQSAPLQSETALGLLSMAVRTRSDANTAIPNVARTIRDADANLGIDAIIPVERLVSSSVTRPRFYAVLLALFAGVASILAALGVYGVLAYSVTQRTHEIGVRMALGAQRRQVVGLVLREGVILTGVGVAVGLAAAAAGTKAIQGMLFNVTALDPSTFVAVAIGFSLVATAACYIPARRAASVDPNIALRSE